MQIRTSAECRYDLLSLGECMVRFSPPGHGRIEFANNLEIYVGGGEYNVAYALSRLGLRSGFISRLVDNPLGKLILNHGQAVGVDMSPVQLVKYDGIGRADRIGLNFTEVGAGVRGSVTLYDRGHSAASNIKPGMFDVPSLFKPGTRWFHTGGIFAALSDGCSAVCRETLSAAKQSGAVTSYDLNYRSKLWSAQQAQRVTKELVPLIDCLIGNEEDFQKVLGFDVEGGDPNLSALDTGAYKKMVQQVVKAYPNIRVVGTTLREVKSGRVNNWSAILYVDGAFYESRRYDSLEIEDRVGGGDGFCSGFVYGFLTGRSPQECVELGAAHGALVQTTRGDTSQIDLEELLHVAGGGSARIRR